MRWCLFAAATSALAPRWTKRNARTARRAAPELPPEALGEENVGARLDCEYGPLGLSDAADDFVEHLAGDEIAEHRVDLFGEPLDEVSNTTAAGSLEDTLRALRSSTPTHVPREERVFCSRNLNLQGIKVVGYDMDYTIVHYKWREWETLAYECTKECLSELGFPVSDLAFDDPDLACRGLVIDTDRGNFLKIDRHGFVRRAMHGRERLDSAAVDALYGRRQVDLRDRRFSFLNTLFSVSEGVLYSQLVSKLDSGALVREATPPFDPARVATYADLYRAVTSALARAHGGKATPSGIKEAVVADPARYTQREPELLRRTLADQRRAGKKLALITNSDWWYTDTMMRFVLDMGGDWRSLFDVVVVSARKPAFFTTEKLPFYEIDVDPMAVAGKSALMREGKLMREGQVYCGGSAVLVEKLFRSSESEMLYVGDHIFTDANAVKASMRWRTALVVQELDQEIRAERVERERSKAADGLLARRDDLYMHANGIRCALERWDATGKPTHPYVVDSDSAEAAKGHLDTLIAAAADIDVELDGLLYSEGAAANRHWGYLTRAGHNDKSHLHRQIEKYADVYCAKVTNFCRYTPYHYFRAAPQVLAHEVDSEMIEAPRWD